MRINRITIKNYGTEKELTRRKNFAAPLYGCFGSDGKVISG
jgi:hypothetical protein